MEKYEEIIEHLQKVKRFGYGMMAAGLVTALTFFGGTIYSAEKAQALSNDLDINKACIYMDHVATQNCKEVERQLYFEYRDGKISAQEFNKRFEELHSQECVKEVIENGDINIISDIREMEEEKEKLSDQTMILSIPGMVGTIAAISGGALIGEPAEDKIKKLEEERVLGE